jgi:regulatory protein
MVEQSQDTHNYPKHKGKNNNSNKSKFTQEKKPKIPKKITARYLHNSGLAYLQRFPASSMHFRTIMMRKIHKSCRHHTEQNMEDCQALLEDLIVKFHDLSLLDDKGYLRGMIRSLRKRGLSSKQIAQKLQQKGYERDAIESAVMVHDREEFESEYEGDFYAALTFARRKKLGPFDVMNKRDPEKSLASMARAGYSYGIAKKVLDMDADDIPDLFR